MHLSLIKSQKQYCVGERVGNKTELPTLVKIYLFKKGLTNSSIISMCMGALLSAEM